MFHNGGGGVRFPTTHPTADLAQPMLASVPCPVKISEGGRLIEAGINAEASGAVERGGGSDDLKPGDCEMVVDGGGHFSPALYRWFTHMSLLFSSSTAHSRAVGNPI